MKRDYPSRILVSVDALSAETKFALYDNAPSQELQPDEILEQLEADAHDHGMTTVDYLAIYRNNH